MRRGWPVPPPMEVVDVGETMGERASERGGGVGGQSGQALAHVSGRHDMLPLTQEAGRSAVVGHGDHRVDMRPPEPEGRYEARLTGTATDGNRPEALIGHSLLLRFALARSRWEILTWY